MSTDNLFFITMTIICSIFVGMLIGVVLQKNYDADALSVLVDKTQEQFWELNGLEQQVKQYESNPCTNTIIQTQYTSKGETK